MNTRWGYLLSIAIGGTYVWGANCALAQITPDSTLPNNSIVTPSGTTLLIEGGTQAGGNLFHSFEQFSIPTSNTAFFNNAVEIQNIISRVTGGLPSNIDGIIRANGTANLFFINPNGIIFGPNASLDIRGSFVASTANSLRFADGTEFSTTNPQAPALLTVSVPIGLQFGPNPGEIVNQSQASPNGAVNSFGLPVGLQVQSGKTLALVGGNVSLQGGNLTAAGGRIELGSVGTGLVNLTEIPQSYALGYADVQNFQNIQLSDGALVDASGEGGGDIQVQGRNINLTGDAAIFSITSGAGTGGTLTVNAAESVNLSGNLTELSTSTLGTGSAGNLTLTTRNLTVEGGARIFSRTSGVGTGGNLTVDAAESINLSGNLTLLSTSTLGTGSAGNLTLTTRNLTVEGGARIFSTTSGIGTAGNLTVDAGESVNLSGNNTVLTTFTSGAGSAGNLTLTTRNLIVERGAVIATSSRGQGRSGEMLVRASDAVELIGTTADGQFPSGLSTQVGRDAIGNGGNLTIETGRLTIRDGAAVDASTSGAATAGNVVVRAVDSINLVGGSPDSRFPSGIFAQVREGGIGNAGTLTIETQRLTIQGGAQISTAARTRGNGEDLTINALDSIKLSGTLPTATLTSGSSGIFVSAEPGATTGNVGTLNISSNLLTVENGARISADNFGRDNLAGTATLNVRQLFIRDGGQVRAGSFAEGPGGTLTVNATESVQVIGTGTIGSTPVVSSLFTQAQGSGNAGNLNITTPSLNVQDGAEVTVSGTGSGPAGNLNVRAKTISLNQGRLTAETNAGEGANISIQDLDLLLMQNQSLISAQAFNNANGGNINIDAPNGFVVTVPEQNNDIIANASQGQGGEINIITTGIFGIEERRATPRNTTNDIDASSEFGLPGTVTINTPDVDPNRGLVELPTGVVDASRLVASNCSAFAASSSSFVITGRGGLPPSPQEPLSSDMVWSDTRLPNRESSENLRASTTTPQVTPQRRDRIAIVPATGWVFNDKGEVTLISASNATSLGSNPASCQTR